MKKILSLVVVLLMVVALASVASAQSYGDSRIGNVRLNSKTVYNVQSAGYGHTHITTSPTAVYRLTYTSQTAGGYVALYDSATTGQYATIRAEVDALSAPAIGGNSFVKTCVGAAAADTVYQVTYDPPLQFDAGVMVGFPNYIQNQDDGSSVTVEYRQN